MTPDLITSEMVEKAARGIFETRHRGVRNCHQWDSSGLDDEHPGARERYLRDARAALTAILPDVVETCAKVAEKRCSESAHNDFHRGIRITAKEIAADIRALSPPTTKERKDDR